ncbi:MAG: hypothetical protein ACREIG_01600 [Nitrospiraceae bacterium]
MLTTIGAMLTAAFPNLIPFPSLNSPLDVHAVVGEGVGIHG